MEEKPVDDTQAQAAPEIMEVRVNSAAAAALAVLQDGKPRDTATLLRDCIASGALPPTATRDSLYVTLTDYITRIVARGQRPEIVEDPVAKEFHVNHPADDWPDVALPPRPHNISPETLATISELLRSTATGGDPGAFENAVCDAFTLMGFIATHVGGNGKRTARSTPHSARSDTGRSSSARPRRRAWRKTSLRRSRRSFGNRTARPRSSS